MQLRLSDKEIEWLYNESRITGKTVSTIIRDIIDKHINHSYTIGDVHGGREKEKECIPYKDL